jgi:hypothetical protein
LSKATTPAFSRSASGSWRVCAWRGSRRDDRRAVSWAPRQGGARMGRVRGSLLAGTANQVA